jgi:hypothetical protein
MIYHEVSLVPLTAMTSLLRTTNDSTTPHTHTTTTTMVMTKKGGTIRTTVEIFSMLRWPHHHQQHLITGRTQHARDKSLMTQNTIRVVVS